MGQRLLAGLLITPDSIGVEFLQFRIGFAGRFPVQAVFVLPPVFLKSHASGGHIPLNLAVHNSLEVAHQAAVQVGERCHQVSQADISGGPSHISGACLIIAVQTPGADGAL